MHDYGVIKHLHIKLLFWPTSRDSVLVIDYWPRTNFFHFSPALHSMTSFGPSSTETSAVKELEHPARAPGTKKPTRNISTAFRSTRTVRWDLSPYDRIISIVLPSRRRKKMPVEKVLILKQPQTYLKNLENLAQTNHSIRRYGLQTLRLNWAVGASF